MILEDGTKVFFEDMGSPGDIGYKIAYIKVDEETNNKLKKVKRGMLVEGSKSEYESLKKKLLENPLPPLWREEISGNNQPRQTRQLNAVGDKEPAAEAIDVQAKAVSLPEESKPKTGKRKSSGTT